MLLHAVCSPPSACPGRAARLCAHLRLPAPVVRRVLRQCALSNALGEQRLGIQFVVESRYWAGAHRRAVLVRRHSCWLATV